MYASFKKLFNYVSINKIKKFDKSINSRFDDFRDIIDRIRVATEERDILENIMIIIALKSLLDEYESKKNYILNIKNISTKKIQSDFVFEKVRLKIDRAIEATFNITLRIKQESRRTQISNKTKRTCYCCEKSDHLVRDCLDFSDEKFKRLRRKRRETKREEKRRSKKLNKVANKESSSSDEKVEVFKSDKINMTAYKENRDENK